MRAKGLLMAVALLVVVVAGGWLALGDRSTFTGGGLGPAPIQPLRSADALDSRTERPSAAVSAAAVVPALGVTDPQISVSPATELVDGQSVVVHISGFGIGSIVYLSECATRGAVNDLGCGSELTAQSRLATGDDRAGTTTFVVNAQAAAGPLTTGAIEACSDQCMIVATLGGGFDYVSTPIAFQAP